MVEIKLQIDDTLVQAFGQAEVEKKLHEYVTKLRLKMAAQDILAEFPSIDLENDAQWQASRTASWEYYKKRMNV